MSPGASFAPFLVVVVVAMVALVWGWTGLWPAWLAWLESHGILSAQRALEPCLGFPGLESGGFTGTRLTGTFEGHELELSRSTRQVLNSSESILRYALRLPGRAYDQELPRAQGLREALGEGAQATSVRSALEHLGKVSDMTLAVEGGWLVLERQLTGYASGHRSLAMTFSAMAELVPLFARVKLDVHVSPRDAAAEVADGGALTLAWSEGGSDQPLCPYCRDDLEPAAMELARCESCHTLHHAECLEELGRCSVFGCGGEDRERVRARA